MGKHLSKETIKAIAVYQNENPDKTIQQVADHFNVPHHKANYAIRKYSKDMDLLNSTRKGRNTTAKIMAGQIDDVKVFREQVNLVLTELQVNDEFSPLQRAGLLSLVLKLKKGIQSLELQNHMKRADALLVEAIIKRFIPDATNDQIIKIYQEEASKLDFDLYDSNN